MAWGAGGSRRTARRSRRPQGARRWRSLWLAIAFLGPAAAWAQSSSSTQPNVILEPLRQAPRQTEDVRGAGSDAATQRLLSPDREVTYDDVLAHPDDIGINFAYAQIQIRRGDLHDATATLERILLINPDLPRVRLLYAIVLYRLDNLDEAERELLAVRGYQMPASLHAELDRYLAEIKLRRQTTRYTLTVSANTQWDWNKNASAASGLNLVSDFPATLEGHNQRRSDLSLLALTRLDVAHDLGYQSRHQITGAVSYYRDQQKNLTEFDLSAASVELGGVYDASPVSIIPNLYRRRIMLDNMFYAYTTGADLRAVDQLDADTQIYVLGEIESQKYSPIGIEPNAPDYDGWQYLTGTGVNYLLNPSMRLGLEADILRKLAVRNFYSYDGARLSAVHTWAFANGMFLITSLSAEQDMYKESYPLVSDKTRHDRIGRGRVTLGAPVALAFDEAVRDADALRDLTFTVSFEAVRQLSNLTNYTYNNRSGAVGFTKRWEF